ALAVIRYAKIYGTKHRPRLTGLQSRVAEARTADEFEHAFASLKAGNAEGVMLLADPTVIENGKKIAELALAAGLPTALQRRENVEAAASFLMAAVLQASSSLPPMHACNHGHLHRCGAKCALL